MGSYDFFKGLITVGMEIRQQHLNDLLSGAGARPTNDISIEFEIRSKFGVL